jgi:hypothetical protein
MTNGAEVIRKNSSAQNSIASEKQSDKDATPPVFLTETSVHFKV